MATATGSVIVLMPFYFNPRRPYGWRPQASPEKNLDSKFQSTPPIRVATRQIDVAMSSLKFQSTPPIRVATSVDGISVQVSQISIHATHTGGDRERHVHTNVEFDFNPRHPYGWRLSLFWASRLFSTFQSTPPIRVATVRRDRDASRQTISIHATHTGGD